MGSLACPESEERREHPDTLEPQVTEDSTEFPVSREIAACPVCPDNLDCPDRRETPVFPDSLEPRAATDTPERMDCLVCRELRETTDTPEDLDVTDSVGRPERKVWVDSRVFPALLVNRSLDLSDPMEHQDTPERMDFLDCLEPKETAVCQDTLERLDSKETVECPASPEPRESPDNLELLASVETMDFLACPERMVCLDCLESREKPAWVDSPVRLDFLVCQE